jgi:hypothetical protein
MIREETFSDRIKIFVGSVLVVKSSASERCGSGRWSDFPPRRDVL